MNSVVLWENAEFIISTPKNSHITYSEGLHIIVAPRVDTPSAWSDIEISTRAFKLSSQVCKILDEIDMAPWFNIQANGNWGLLEGNSPFFHIHIYGRNKTSSWGKPLVLPLAPKTYANEPMPESDREQISHALGNLVT